LKEKESNIYTNERYSSQTKIGGVSYHRNNEGKYINQQFNQYDNQHDNYKEHEKSSLNLYEIIITFLNTYKNSITKWSDSSLDQPFRLEFIRLAPCDVYQIFQNAINDENFANYCKKQYDDVFEPKLSDYEDKSKTLTLHIKICLGRLLMSNTPWLGLLQSLYDAIITFDIRLSCAHLGASKISKTFHQIQSKKYKKYKNKYNNND